MEIIKKILGKTYPAHILEDMLLHKHRRTILKILFVTDLILALFINFDFSGVNFVRGVFLIIASLILILFCLDAYFYSFYKKSHERNDLLPFEIGEILYYSDEEDITKGFIWSDVGDISLKMLGINEGEIAEFIKDKDIIKFDDIFEYQEWPATIEDYMQMIVRHDKEFDDFLAKKNIKIKELIEALEYVVNVEKSCIQNEMWWSKGALKCTSPLSKRLLLLINPQI